jgi:hypothetical protein
VTTAGDESTGEASTVAGAARARNARVAASRHSEDAQVPVFIVKDFLPVMSENSACPLCGGTVVVTEKSTDTLAPANGTVGSLQ